MPFVRRKRTYYKDGVEVPESSIIDFGSYKYFKNIVTTKYWKEITTGGKELEYACYNKDQYYIYIKAPIGSDLDQYGSSDNTGRLVSSSDELKYALDGDSITKSLTEDEYVWDLGFGAATYTRYRDGDLYKDTTVTEIVEGTPEDYTYTTEEVTPVEVSASDEYDFTEFVPSAEFDNYVDDNKFYSITKRHRDYYKYIYQDWTQPVLTTNGVMGGNSFAVSTNVAQYSGSSAYHLFDNSSATNFHSNKGTTTGHIDLYNPKPLIITNIVMNNQTGNANRASSAGTVYGSDNGSSWEKIKEYTNSVQDGSASWSIDLSSNKKGYNYYRIESTSGGSGGYWVIGGLNITAQEREKIGGTAESADYYVDTNKYCNLTYENKVY